MKVHIDADRCQGHGRCYALAPQLFDADDIGNGVELNGGLVPDGEQAAARRAALNCPESAVIVEED
jgi:ferredoxin